MSDGDGGGGGWWSRLWGQGSRRTTEEEGGGDGGSGKGKRKKRRSTDDGAIMLGKVRVNSLRGNFVSKYETPIDRDFDVDISRLLGRGAYGSVIVGTKRVNSREYAVKFIEKVARIKRVEREVKILTDIDHANIVRLYSLYDTPAEVGFVMELCTGGHLEDYLNSRPSRFLPENEAKALIRQLVSAVAHIHSRGICHRDIKLQNILIENADAPTPQLKLIDFGFATRFVGVTPLKTRIGTPYTTAPEVFKQNYDERCDVWSAGVVSYIIVSGFRPFPSSAVVHGEFAAQPTKAALVSSIIKGKYHFNHAPFFQVSTSCIHFLKSMLTNNYQQRWHARDALNSGWISGSLEELSVDFSALSQNPESPLAQAVKNMRTKTTWPYLSNVVMAIVAFNRSQQTCPELRKLFELFDIDSLGFLDLSRFKDAMKAVAPDMSSQDAEALFHTMDIDIDKQLSFIEFCGGSINPREVSASEYTEAFRLLDADGKGIIVVDDFYRIILEAPKKRRNSKLSKAPEQKGSSTNSNHDDISSSGTGFFSENMFVRGERELRLAARIRHMLVSADADLDGALSYSEFLHGALAENIGILSETDEINASELLAFDEDAANSKKSTSSIDADPSGCFRYLLSLSFGGMRYRVRRFFKRKSSRAVPINTEMAIQMHMEQLEEERRQQLLAEQDGRKDSEVSRREVHLEDDTEGELVDGLDPVVMSIINGIYPAEFSSEETAEAAPERMPAAPMNARIDAYVRQREEYESRQEYQDRQSGNSLYDAGSNDRSGDLSYAEEDREFAVQKRQPDVSYSSYIDGPMLPAPAPMVDNPYYTDGFSSASSDNERKSRRENAIVAEYRRSAKISSKTGSHSHSSSSSSSNYSSSSEKHIVVRRSRSAGAGGGGGDEDAEDLEEQENHSLAPGPPITAAAAVAVAISGSPGPLRASSVVRGGKLPPLSRP